MMSAETMNDIEQYLPKTYNETIDKVVLREKISLLDVDRHWIQ